ncbi:MAG: TraR/DksA C4-type zinc finger protein [bacterium]|nr:TraR/DksA C4-type zinc finger protein [bacterium]
MIKDRTNFPRTKSEEEEEKLQAAGWQGVRDSWEDYVAELVHVPVHEVLDWLKVNGLTVGLVLRWRQVFETRLKAKDAESEEIMKRQMGNVLTAVRRCKEKNQGICLGCGQEIPVERLEAVPEATRCVLCQRKFEGEQWVAYCPVEVCEVA